MATRHSVQRWVAVISTAAICFGWLSSASAQPPEDLRLIHREFEFEVRDSVRARLIVNVSRAEYLAATASYAQATEQQRIDIAVAWVRESSLPSAIVSIARQHRIAPLDVAVSFVQSFPYLAGVGRALHPVETLVEGQPDCDDRALLALGLAEALGVRAALWLWVGMPHAGLGVAAPPSTLARSRASVEVEGVTYAYVELTSRGWPIGELPDHHTDRVSLGVPSRSPLPHSQAAPPPAPGRIAPEVPPPLPRRDDDVVANAVTAFAFGATDSLRGVETTRTLALLGIPVSRGELSDVLPDELRHVALRLRPEDVGVVLRSASGHRVSILVNPSVGAITAALSRLLE